MCLFVVVATLQMPIQEIRKAQPLLNGPRNFFYEECALPTSVSPFLSSLGGWPPLVDEEVEWGRTFLTPSLPTQVTQTPTCDPVLPTLL